MEETKATTQILGSYIGPAFIASLKQAVVHLSVQAYLHCWVCDLESTLWCLQRLVTPILYEAQASL
jgi:hypothetical protein